VSPALIRLSSRVVSASIGHITVLSATCSTSDASIPTALNTPASGGTNRFELSGIDLQRNGRFRDRLPHVMS